MEQPCEVDLLKGRIGEALVESIFVESRYRVCRAGRESQLPQLLRKGPGDSLPDFLVWRSVGTSSAGGPLYRLLSIEVKYCWSVEGFLRRYSETLPPRGRWAELYAVLVTDRPEPGRSCFQALDLGGSEPRGPIASVDLHDIPDLRISKRTVERYEDLAVRLFSQLDAAPRAEDRAKKPPAKVAARAGASAPPLSQRSSSDGAPA